MLDKKTLVLEYDDFHWKNPENCLDTLGSLIDRFPSIKISLFTTPCHSGLSLSNDKSWCDAVRKLIQQNNIRLAAHGLHHNQEEFKYLASDDCKLRLRMIESEFNAARLPFTKVFRGPHWGINANAYNELVRANYTHIYTHEDYLALTNDLRIKSVFYNWNLKDEAPECDFLIGHGHTHPVCQNGMEETFNRVCSFIDKYKPEFKFVDEV